MIKKVVCKILVSIGTLLTLLITFLATLLFFAIRWMFDTWNNLSMDELVYHLTTPLDGADSGLVMEFMGECMAPAVIVLFLLMFVYLGLRGKKKYYIVMAIAAIIPCVVARNEVASACDTLDAENFVKSKGTESTFIEDYYVSPADVALEFPEQERNLIYIYLESMETTYADQENGGAFDVNVIPELTKLAQENEDFSGTDKQLNGGYSLTGTTWTMGGLFAQTSGLPLEISVQGNNMDTQDSFFSGIITLGDILNEAGYKQMLMIGSDATFGGRRLYFTEHGNYEMCDYFDAIEKGRIPEDYHVFWGYEDQRLFANAKEELIKLASQDQPFNFTMLTVDTHFEDGWVCELCPDTYGDNQYANVMACSSAQVADFVEWIRQQDFYENTTIVISGDHPTMDKNFCENIDSEYDRKTYTAYINSAVTPVNNQRRVFATLDQFPTTLAAMGVNIEGNRLGLGTNLFSDRPTISEEIGLDNEDEELGKKSVFMENLANINEKSELLLKRQGIYPAAQFVTSAYDYNNGYFYLELSDISNVNIVDSVRAAVWKAEDQSDLVWIDLEPGEDGIFRAAADVASFGYEQGEYHMQAYVTDGDGDEYMVGEVSGMLW
ncbi:MAG: sulfatase-like hydrolase/transferase [Eubacteriales bacterium]|nr:sulfatase-like hydrolase/transferase [Eubacteriales bacterium]